ncbi:CapA family protein [Nocardia sp. KC 131]|uniref:CapA family protein n=1 Tax=Nocardia arseniciresistens TaxID=3392119 RepID=UPI00398F43D4
MVDDSDPVTVLLGGDVMLGRGVDQILPHPGVPILRERYVGDARTYVELAEQANGPIPQPVDFSWLWGDALPMLETLAPEVRLLNLETAITADGEFADRKGIHYRMHPDNLPALTAIRPDVCALANNHILDFGCRGMKDTIDALAAAGIHGVGAGADAETAHRPAVLTVRDEHRAVIASVASRSSGVPGSWAALHDRPGVWLIDDSSARRAADDIAAQVLAHKHTGDITVVSVHWGPNWGYGVGLSEIQFAHRLIDAGIDVVHGHSSHHPRPIEIYRDRLILYGCGDVIDDYEGIRGYESYRAELRLLYIASIHPGGGELAALRMLPFRVRRLRLERAARVDAQWLRTTIEHISRRFRIRVVPGPEDLLIVERKPGRLPHFA